MSETRLLTNTLADTPPYSVANTATRSRYDPFGTPLTALPDTFPRNAEPRFGAVASCRANEVIPYGIIDMGSAGVEFCESASDAHRKYSSQFPKI
jgi:hypothetical protein